MLLAGGFNLTEDVVAGTNTALRITQHDLLSSTDKLLAKFERNTASDCPEGLAYLQAQRAENLSGSDITINMSIRDTMKQKCPQGR
jgi:hypothetical protein